MGSSPLARGGLADLPEPLLKVGAHPRWRGADLDPIEIVLAERGSSPLARGGPSWPRCPLRNTGLIPAGAGRTTAQR